MEMQQLLKILNKEKKIAIYIFCSFISIGCVFYLVQPIRYSTSLMLNVTRKSVQNTDAYRYDEFYRLQADERFADTIVKWLYSPNVVNEIMKESGNSATDLRDIIEAKRLSSQMIQVTFKTRSPDSGKVIAKSIEDVIRKQTDQLDKEQKDPTWFMVVASKPLVSSYLISFVRILFASITLGVFFGFWAALIKHYFKKQ